MERVIKIRELTFSAAHYLPGHPKCEVIHGHTYVVRNLEILCSAFVDFGDVRDVIRSWDHTFIVPESTAQFFLDDVGPLLKKANCAVKLRRTNGSPTVENIAQQIAEELKSLPGVESVRLELYEGLNEGTVYDETRKV